MANPPSRRVSTEGAEKYLWVQRELKGVSSPAIRKRRERARPNRLSNTSLISKPLGGSFSQGLKLSAL
jgi:hypothetical protein